MYTQGWKKNKIKNRWLEPFHGRQNEKAKERSKDEHPTRTKKGRGLVLLMVGSYLTHDPYNVAFTQIVRSNSNGRSKTCITRQCNLPFYSRG